MMRPAIQRPLSFSDFFFCLYETMNHSAERESTRAPSDVIDLIAFFKYRTWSQTLCAIDRQRCFRIKTRTSKLYRNEIKYVKCFLKQCSSRAHLFLKAEKTHCRSLIGRCSTINIHFSKNRVPITTITKRLVIISLVSKQAQQSNR